MNAGMVRQVLPLSIQPRGDSLSFRPGVQECLISELKLRVNKIIRGLTFGAHKNVY